MDHDPSNGASDAEEEPEQAEEPLETLEPGPTPPPFGDPTVTRRDTSGAPGWGTPGATWAATTQPPPPIRYDAPAPPPPPPPSFAYAPGGSGDPGEPTVPSSAWTPLPASAPDGGERRERSGVRSAVIGGIAGALIGALAAGGIVAAVDDNGNTRTIVEAPGTNAATRPASVIQSPGDIQSILAKVSPAVVRINVTISSSGLGGSGQGVGTGFVVSPDGVIVTNAHVVDNADSVQVQLANGKLIAARVVGASTASDLAVVKIDAKNLSTVALGDSDALQVGDQVVAIGNALGLEGAPTVTSGIVSGLNRVLVEPGTNASPNGVDIPNTIQTDAAINPGNSGGPLVDANGNVVGINTAIADPSNSNNVGFAIAISPAKRIIDSLRKGQQPELPFLGVGTTAVDAAAKSRYNLSVDQGAYVSSLSSGSGAAKAGIRQG
ncbi:MAG: serine protease Do, partial [Actinomycetota bacterium]|nr:serine protease Do [Actinomycetota bacterium]